MSYTRILKLAALLFLLTLGPSKRPGSPAVAASPEPALTGEVRSQEEGLMEGVLVSAKAPGSGTTTSVVTDAKGRYEFPGTGMPAGRYEIEIRAVGYDIAAGANPSVQLTPGTSARLDLQLRKTSDLAAQLTSAEWLMSVPGTQKQKEFLYRCVVCHTLAPVVYSKYNAVEFLAVMNRMRNFPPQSFPRKVFKLPREVPSSPEAEELVKVRNLEGPMPRYGFSISRAAGQPEDAYAAQYLSTVNLGASGKWKYELKTLPRLKGRSTRVIFTEYDLPNPQFQPHDAAADPDGVLWHTDFTLPFLGQLDPKTGVPKQWPLPGAEQAPESSAGDIHIDRDGNPWVGFQSQLVKFDRKTQKFQTYPTPEFEGVRAGIGFFSIAVNGEVVFLGNGVVHHLDPATGKFRSAKFSVPPGINGQFYGWTVDSRARVYGALQWDHAVGEIDEAAGKMIIHPTPTQGSGPRRVEMDSQDRFWFAEYLAHKLAVFDTRTRQFKEWPVPTPWSGGYDVVVDKNGEVWGGGMHTDRIYRFNPKTETFTEYLTPRELNLRRIDVDNSTTPVTVWIGNNHQAKLLRMQPLD